MVRTNGKYIVCDRGNERSRMQIFTKFGAFVKKIAIRYIDIVAGLAITSQGERLCKHYLHYIQFICNAKMETLTIQGQKTLPLNISLRFIQD